jgi:hypothetical protein
MALGSTRPLTEMSNRNISWRIKAAGALCWQPYHLRVSNVLKSGSLNLLEPSGPVQACDGIAFTFYHILTITMNFNHTCNQLTCSPLEEDIIMSSCLPHVWKLAALGFKSSMFYMFLPEDSGRPPKHLGVHNVYFIYILRVLKYFVFNKNKSVCLFSWRYNRLWLYFHSPAAGLASLFSRGF